METNHDLGKLEEEFNNFMFKVTEVSNIVSKLTSGDKNLQEIGDLEAKKFLGETAEKRLEDLEDKKILLKVKSNRTIINQAALNTPTGNMSEMSQEAFMEEVSRDADKRYKEKLIRREKMETFKKQANLAFSRGEFEKALTLYNKAIEQIKDSCMLYNNRALACVNLKLYDRAKEDLKLALRLNEDCLKSWLLLAKVHSLEGDLEEFEKTVQEARIRNPGKEDFIKEYTNTQRNKMKRHNL